MTAAPARIAAVAVSFAAGLECAELCTPQASGMCDDRTAMHPEAATHPEAASLPVIDGPSGRGDASTERTNWSRRNWSSTAAFTIGKPPRAPRVG